MRHTFKSLVLPFLALLVIAGATAAFAVQASVELDTSIEYAEYRNDRWQYSLAVPADMTVSEHEREGGGHSVQITDVTGEKELIISAWPYTQLDLTLGREGTPSDASDQPDHLEIVNVLRDDVFKVLFTKNGTLYVVTTLPEYEAWLTDILKTWEFTE
jgi:hypothetical protein